ncbi:MAG: AbrB/MazE/SpoVT family DNA-binding domain-containing protein [Proteobacteria bacterium]|nr:AbrB/MazE/SpoVT family DNA-binding domain-containing protein [Pseudomonadota bacterium]
MAKVGRKGQITIPKAARDRLGLKPGSVVEFKLAQDGRVVLVNTQARPPSSRFATLRGRAGRGLSTDEIIALTRGDDRA